MVDYMIDAPQMKIVKVVEDTHTKLLILKAESKASSFDIVIKNLLKLNEKKEMKINDKGNNPTAKR